MQPLLEGHFTMEELLNLIETRKPTFWNKMGKAFKNDARKGGKKKVFILKVPTVEEQQAWVECIKDTRDKVSYLPCLL